MSKIQTKNLILKVENYKLLAFNSSILDFQEIANLTADVLSGTSSLTIDNINNFSNTDLILIEGINIPKAELNIINGAPSGSTITLTTALKFNHSTNIRVYKIPYNKVEFARATTINGVKTTLETVNIMVDRSWTEYQDDVNSTGFAFFRFTDGVNYSEWSEGISYQGNEFRTVEQLSYNACLDMGVEVGDTNATQEQLINDVRNAQSQIQQKREWGFEEVEGVITSKVNEFEYSLNLLNPLPKNLFNGNSFFRVLFGTIPLTKISSQEMDKYFVDKPYSKLVNDVNIGDTFITLENTAEFDEQGTAYVGGNLISFTNNDTSTGILSGIPATGTGSIEILTLEDTNVFQDLQPNRPYFYCIDNGKLKVNCPIDINLEGIEFKVKYIGQITEINSFADTVFLPNPYYSVIQTFIKACIEARVKSTSLIGTGHYEEFKISLAEISKQTPIKMKDSKKSYYFRRNNFRSRINST